MLNEGNSNFSIRLKKNLIEGGQIQPTRTQSLAPCPVCSAAVGSLSTSAASVCRASSHWSVGNLLHAARACVVALVLLLQQLMEVLEYQGTLCTGMRRWLVYSAGPRDRKNKYSTFRGFLSVDVLDHHRVNLGACHPRMMCVRVSNSFFYLSFFPFFSY